MIARFCIAFQFGLFFVSVCEFYPTSIKTIGLSVASFFGAVGTVISEVVLTATRQLAINPFLIIATVFGLVIVGYQWIPETYGMEPQDQIQEMR